MKKIALALFLALLLTAPALGATVTESRTFTWEHAPADYPLISSWTLYQADSEAGPWTAVLTIDHPDSLPLSVATGEFTVTGNSGATVTKYFRLTAWSRSSGTETAPSNVASTSFKIPVPEPGAPSVLTITVQITAK